MLEIKNRSEDKNYTSNGALLVIKHTINANDIVKLLQIYKLEHGEEVFNSMLAQVVDEQKANGPYLCFVENGGAPKYKHQNKTDALDEAKRLAAKTGQVTYVLSYVAKIVPKTQITYEVQL